VTSAVELDALAVALRTSPALRAKRGIGLVGEVFGAHSWVHGPGDDGAVVNANGTQVVACGEALLPAFVAADPYGAGLAAVLTNVNDLAAMGATPLGIVDTIVGDESTARMALRGMQEGCRIYDVPLVGGHLTLHDGAPAVSAFGIGWARRVLSATQVAPGQALVVACCTAGRHASSRLPFFASFRRGGAQLEERPTSQNRAGACGRWPESHGVYAAKDVQHGGPDRVAGECCGVEPGRRYTGRPPTPSRAHRTVALDSWLSPMLSRSSRSCLARQPDDEADCLHAFRARVNLDAAVIGEVDATGVLAVEQGGDARLSSTCASRA
jgi:selenophosphate synthetase-related protein